MPRLTIDGQQVEAPEGATILEAARLIGVEIPTLCYHEGLPAQTSCMVCVVRVDGAQRLRPACATPIREGMIVETQAPEVINARRMALELLLSDHLGDCLAPCQLGCPAGLDIPLMIRQIVAGDLAGATETVLARIPLPGVLGRVCPAPCEGTCRRGTVDQPVAIRLLKRWVADADRSAPTWRPEVARQTGRRVAIVGAGPAGLSAAYYLRLLGHEVTLIDESAQPGGGLCRTAPSELPPDVLADDVERVLALGVEFQPETQLGRDVTLAQLQRHFDAVVIAIGESDEATAEAIGLPWGHRGFEADRHTHAGPLEAVFVAGSSLSPSHMAVRAVASGRAAALSVDMFVRRKEIAPEGRPFNVTMGRLLREEALRLAADASVHGRIEPSRGEGAGFNDEEAVREGLRCMHCDCRALPTCRLRALGEQYHADTHAWHGQRRLFRRDGTHPAIIFEPGKCIACGLCIEVAKRYAEELGLTFIGRGFDVRTAVPFGAPLAEGLRRAALECAEVCPTGALVQADEAEEEAGGDEERWRADADGGSPDEAV
jgi:ferredoxin